MKETTLLFTAIRQLKVDVPVLRYEIEAGSGDAPRAIRLYLYGGRVVAWSAEREALGELPAERRINPTPRQTTRRTKKSAPQGAAR